MANIRLLTQHVFLNAGSRYIVIATVGGACCFVCLPALRGVEAAAGASRGAAERSARGAGRRGGRGARLAPRHRNAVTHQNIQISREKITSRARRTRQHVGCAAHSLSPRRGNFIRVPDTRRADLTLISVVVSSTLAAGSRRTAAEAPRALIRSRCASGRVQLYRTARRSVPSLGGGARPTCAATRCDPAADNLDVSQAQPTCLLVAVGADGRGVPSAGVGAGARAPPAPRRPALPPPHHARHLR